MKTNRMRLAAAFAVPVLLMAAAFAPPPSAVADAALRGNLAAVKTLILQGVNVNAPQGDGMTALHWASDRGDGAMVDVLLKASADVKATTRVGAYTPLHIAAKGGHGEIVASLVKAGSDVNAMTSTGATALHFASASGASAGIAALLEKGANVNVREREWGQTPLVFAAANNRNEAISVLLKHGADPSLKTRMLVLNDETALEQAAARKRAEVLISFEPEKHCGETPRPIGGADVPTKPDPCPDPIKTGALTMNSLGFAALLPVDPNAGGFGGRGGGGPAPKGPFTPQQIQEAIAAGRVVQTTPAATTGPVTEVVDTINGGIVGFANTVGGVGGLTALHHAVRQGNLEAVSALLAGGAPINVTNDVDKTTPLLQALINGQFDVAMVLIGKGADVNMASAAGLTPLYATINSMWAPRSRFPQPQAVQNQKTAHIAVMDALLKAGAKPNTRLTSQFWYFAYNNCGNANCGLENLEGTTAFWRAAYSLDVDAMKLLVKYGADPTVPSLRNPVAAGRGGRGARGGGGGDDPNAGLANGPPGGRGQVGPALDPAIDSASKAVPAGVGVFPIHNASGVGYGNGFAGNAHRHAPDGWMAAMKYLVEELKADVNARDLGGYTPLHHAAARGDNAMILYLVSKGADVKAVARNGRTTLDMANGPVSRITPIPETMALLAKLGAINTNRCASCW